MIKDLKKAFSITIVAMLTIWFAGCFVAIIHNMIEEKERNTYCGTITKLFSDEVSVKHGSRTDLYLIINFDNYGQKAVEVDVNTYAGKQVGQRVCFNLTNYYMDIVNINPWYVELSGIIGALGAIVLAVSILIKIGTWIYKQITS